jgi:hypothetical protein
LPRDFGGQRAIEATLSIHVLTRLAFSFLLHTRRVGVLVVHVFALRGVEPAESHQSHHRRLGVFVSIVVFGDVGRV